MAKSPDTPNPPGSPGTPGTPGTPGSGGPSAFGGSTRYIDPSTPAEERTYALFMHLVGLLSMASIPVPLAGLIGSLIMWKIKAEKSPFLDDHGRDAVNFQISLLIYHVIMAILVIPTLGLAGLGFVVIVVVTLIGCIRGAMAANRGEYYRYPVTIRFLNDRV
ncbi:MAG: DUF4870 domain-containing protein [Phycisphaerales bacterium]